MPSTSTCLRTSRRETSDPEPQAPRRHGAGGPVWGIVTPRLHGGGHPPFHDAPEGRAGYGFRDADEEVECRGLRVVNRGRHAGKLTLAITNCQVLQQKTYICRYQRKCRWTAYVAACAYVGE